jgi:hypothetical protein
MFSKTKIILSAALILGTASVALANDIDESVSEGQAMREMHGNPLPWWWNNPVQGRGSYVTNASNGSNAYGSVVAPTQQEGVSRKKSHNR